jgi:hypothetical protein
MKRISLTRWLPVGLYGALSLCLIIFGVIPLHRKARHGARETQKLSVALQNQLNVLEELPVKQLELDRLAASMSKFTADLRRTNEVDQVMDEFKGRAMDAGLELWILNPSVPALVDMNSELDSVSHMNLAVLPVTFECRGSFIDVGRFLEAEESRSQFCKWQKLTMFVGSRTGSVHAQGDAYLFLLPEIPTQETAL